MTLTKNTYVIVIGASAGGFVALKRLMTGLPLDFQAAIFIVWHIPPDAYGILPDVLNQLNTLPAIHAEDQMPIETGHIYIAPPDHHLLLENGRMPSAIN